HHRTNVFQTRNAVDALLERPGDGHFHLLDRHDAVIDANDDSREIRRRKDCNRNAQRFINANNRQDEDQKNDRLRETRKPIVVGIFTGNMRHYLSSSGSSLGGAILTFVLLKTSSSSLPSSKAPAVMTRSPLESPSVT